MYVIPRARVHDFFSYKGEKKYIILYRDIFMNAKYLTCCVAPDYVSQTRKIGKKL